MPTTEETPKAPETKQHYFLVSGEIEFIEVAKNKAKNSRTMKVNGVHASPENKLPARMLGSIQTMLQMHFHAKYSKTHPSPPEEITDAIITSIFYLGEFTNTEFTKDVQSDPPTPGTPAKS